MSVNKFTVVRCIDHIAGSNDYIRLRHTLDTIHVFDVSCDVCAVNVADLSVFCIHYTQVAPLGVDVIVTPGAEMFCQGAGFSAYIDLNIINSAVAHIRNREINNAVSAEEGECSYRAVLLKAVYLNVISGKINDSKCLIHIIRPPLHVLQQVRYSHCPRCRQRHFCLS